MQHNIHIDPKTNLQRRIFLLPTRNWKTAQLALQWSRDELPAVTDAPQRGFHSLYLALYLRQALFLSCIPFQYPSLLQLFDIPSDLTVCIVAIIPSGGTID
jgi:hypothetical protein